MLAVEAGLLFAIIQFPPFDDFDSFMGCFRFVRLCSVFIFSSTIARSNSKSETGFGSSKIRRWRLMTLLLSVWKNLGDVAYNAPHSTKILAKNQGKVVTSLMQPIQRVAWRGGWPVVLVIIQFFPFEDFARLRFLWVCFSSIIIYYHHQRWHKIGQFSLIAVWD